MSLRLTGPADAPAPFAQPVNLPQPLSEEWNWQLDALCRGYPIEVFFPNTRGRLLLKQEKHAKKICRECPALAPCRDHALRAPETHGVWGALSPRERIDYLRAPHRD